MKITESQLRKIIRKTLNESKDMHKRVLSANGILDLVDEGFDFFEAVDMVLYDREDGFNGQFTRADEEWIMSSLMRKWGPREGSISSLVRDYFAQ